ncbi:hypothetical protein PoB_000097500 [Plakobranchus ocellatus]|uniref:Uncharacterized protein n=1 Tax=Plakobranchus ocellatus TaxID=259542 RepID=A0AAV3XVP1_9GAST|nr:hypothetical protein PoB_000097500 [Plakobranchus ocellatus]
MIPPDVMLHYMENDLDKDRPEQGLMPDTWPSRRQPEVSLCNNGLLLRIAVGMVNSGATLTPAVKMFVRGMSNMVKYVDDLCSRL